MDLVDDRIGGLALRGHVPNLGGAAVAAGVAYNDCRTCHPRRGCGQRALGLFDVLQGLAMCRVSPRRRREGLRAEWRESLHCWRETSAYARQPARVALGRAAVPAEWRATSMDVVDSSLLSAHVFRGRTTGPGDATTCLEDVNYVTRGRNYVTNPRKLRGRGSRAACPKHATT